MISKSVVLIIVSIVAYKHINRIPSLPQHFGGFVDQKFQAVEQLFRDNFAAGRESDGAALAAFHEGRLVIDLWGGYADVEALRPWVRDTTTVVWSTTKALAALAIAHLVDAGRLSYDELVIRHWPEFGANGKHNVTVRMLMGHKAGLAHFTHHLTIDDCSSEEKMSKIVASQTPNHPPGSHTAYHTLTFGFPVSQLIQRVDAKKRTLGQYVQEELIAATGAESCHIGLPPSEDYKVARMRFSSPHGWGGHLKAWLASAVTTVAEWVVGPSAMTKSFMNPWFMLGGTWMERTGFNNPDVHRLEIGAGGAICSARGLAQPFNALVNGKLLKDATIDALLEYPDSLFQPDYTLAMLPQTIGLGLWHSNSTKGTKLLGHPGLGGQMIKFDVKSKLVVAYITNGLKPFTARNEVANQLIDKVHDCL